MKFRTLTADDVEVRIGTVKRNGVTLLLYKNARVDQNLLDETVGAESWQKKYEVINGNLFCSIGVRVFHEDTQEHEWIWKQDVGVESYTEKEKGQASDAFKRAAFCWGIGRELYTAPFIWISSDKCKIDTQNNKVTCYEKFKLKSMQVENGRITALSIVNERGIEVYRLGAVAAQKAAQTATEAHEQKPMYITETESGIIRAELARTGLPEATICGAYHIAKLEEMTLGQFYNCKSRLRATKTKEASNEQS